MDKEEIVYSAWNESDAVIVLTQKVKGMNELQNWVLTGISEMSEPVADEMIEIIEEQTDLKIEKAEEIETVSPEKNAGRQVDLDNNEVVY